MNDLLRLNLRLGVVAITLLLLPASVGLSQTPSPEETSASVMETQYRKLIRTHFSAEPEIRTVQGDAVVYVAAEPGRVRSWFSRAGVAGLAPRRVQVRLDRDFRENISASIKDSLEISGRTDVDDDALWQFMVEWDLSRLVFNPDTIRAASQAIHLAELREDVLNAATKIYFERRSLILELKIKPPRDFAAYARKRLRSDELTADLDALTGGKFSARAKAMKLRSKNKTP